MFKMNPTNILRILFIMAVIIVVSGTVSVANSYTVTVMPESSTTWYAGYLDQGYQSESDDPLAPFSGQSVMFKGYIQPGGATEMHENAYLVCRYKIEFDQDVTFDSVAVTGAGDNTNQGNGAVLRLLDENMDEITIEPLTEFNILLTHTLNTGGVLGRIFYIDEFDYSMNYRYRKNIEIAYHDFEVTNTNDSGSGSLRQAILEANANPGLDIIAFNISGRSKGPYTIQPLTSLPQITDPVIIDGYTQSGAARATDSSPATLLIELDGINLMGPQWGSGLTIYAGSSTVRGLVINRFGDAGVHIEDPSGGNIIEGNYIGTDVTGTLVPGGFGVGVRIWDTPNNRIGGTAPEARNVISGHESEGIAILLPDAKENQILGNYIGTDAIGTAALGNGANGVLIYEGANHNTIGPGNVISNHGYGIQLLSSGNNQIYNNNFIDNTIQAYADANSAGNIFNLEKPIGGNYWSDWTSPDARGDGFVDSPYIFTGGVDYLPWARQDGWLPPQTLSKALDTPLSFTTGGNADWFSQTTTFLYDGDAARSGHILDKQESWMQTTVSGTGTMTFYWEVSSEADYDSLEFYLDGLLQDLISGSVDWQQKTFTITASDSHTLEWRYVKDKCMDSGSDCGWVDKVEWVPSP